MQGGIGVLCLAVALLVGSRIGETGAEQVSHALQGIAAIALAYVGLEGLDAWKKQKRYDQHVGLSADIMAHLFEFQERFAEARSPFGRIGEGVDITNSDALKKAEIEERSRKLVALTSEFNSLVTAVAKVDLWQPKFCDGQMQKIRRSVGELQVACQLYYSMNWKDATPDMKKLNKDYHAKMWGTPDDDFGKVVVDNCEEIRTACRKLTR
jgi:hypothetical protein